MKKNGILHRISTAVLAGAMLLSLASCGASSSQTASSAAGKVTGTGSAKGIEGDVVVEVTADADTIYSIVVTEQNETQGIGSVACEQLPDAMVAANSYNVDGIAGATVTSDALKEAVKAALENAGLDASAFAVAKAADTTVEKTAETLDCDVVVVGAGGAGLTAAAQAAENGAKVILLTHYSDAPGAALADVVLLCGAKESPLDSGSMQVKLAVLFVANVLVLRYTLDNQELANLSLSRTSRALGSKLL